MPHNHICGIQYMYTRDECGRVSKVIKLSNALGNSNSENNRPPVTGDVIHPTLEGCPILTTCSSRGSTFTTRTTRTSRQTIVPVVILV